MLLILIILPCCDAISVLVLVSLRERVNEIKATMIGAVGWERARKEQVSGANWLQEIQTTIL